VRQRQRDGFGPAHTWTIEAGGTFAGRVSLRPAVEAYGLEHFYVAVHLDSSLTCRFVVGPVADRYARPQACGVATADQPGRRRHRDWRTTPKAPQAGKTQAAAIAMP
jgi:hypothetical protein